MEGEAGDLPTAQYRGSDKLVKGFLRDRAEPLHAPRLTSSGFAAEEPSHTRPWAPRTGEWMNPLQDLRPGHPPRAANTKSSRAREKAKGNDPQGGRWGAMRTTRRPGKSQFLALALRRTLLSSMVTLNSILLMPCFLRSPALSARNSRNCSRVVWRPLSPVRSRAANMA